MADEIDGPALDPELAAHVRAWRLKPSLRAVYGDYYRRLLDVLPTDGALLEIGAGSGYSRDAMQGRDVTRLDILPAPWVDTVADAQALPFRNESFDGIFLVDMLHRLAEPRRFFEAAARVLRPGGRLAMVEPAITPLSWVFYSHLSRKPVNMAADPLARQPSGKSMGRIAGNSAIPTLLFRRQEYRIALAEAVPTLRTLDRQWLSLFAYPLTGGYRSWSLLPAGLAGRLLRLEDRLMPALGLLMAFRLFVVLEKRAG